MKTFRKAMKDSECAPAGPHRNRMFLELLDSTRHSKTFRKLIAKYSMKQAQYIYLNGIEKCRCGKTARWNNRTGVYSKWCSAKCQNSDPDKLALQQKAERRTKDALEADLERLRAKFVSFPKAPTTKQIRAFQKIFASLTKEVHEHSVVCALPDTLLSVWFNLNHDSFRYRKRIALGEISFQSFCEVCDNQVKCTMRGDWGKYCSHKCANIANYSKRLAPEATAKMTSSMRRRFADSKEARLLRERL